MTRTRKRIFVHRTFMLKYFIQATGFSDFPLRSLVPSPSPFYSFGVLPSYVTVLSFTFLSIIFILFSFDVLSSPFLSFELCVFQQRNIITFSFISIFFSITIFFVQLSFACLVSEPPSSSLV